MKYTDRKKTPLKWHRTVSFVIQPLLVISVAWILFCMVNELFSLHIPFAWQIFTPVLKSVDSSLRISNLGSMFWPVTGTFFATILFLILCISVWIGFLRWKNSARNLWLIYLLVRTVCMIGGVVYLAGQSDVLRALRTFAVFDSMSRNLLHVIYALIIVICLWSLIFFILNFIYYHKRKLLFAPGYAQPEKEETKTVPSEDQIKEKEETAAISSEEKPEKEDTSVSEMNDKTGDTTVRPAETESAEEKEVSDNTSESETADEEQKETGTSENRDSDQPESVTETQDSSGSDEETADLNTENESVSEQVQVEEKTEDDDQKKPEEAGSDNLPQRDPNQVFCPYCGAKLGKYDVLYCSHCGRKLA